MLITFYKFLILLKQCFLDEDSFHDAGWDSYCAGYCFIKMAHTFAVKRRGT